MDSFKILIFELNGENYALDIKDIERILGYEEPTKLPDNLPFVKGVINYENGILPVISLSKKFGFKEAKDLNLQKIIVLKREINNFGIIVDNVYEVRDVNIDSLETSVLSSSIINKRYIKGLIRLDGKIIIVLDVEEILSEEEEEELF